jgi:hypothetical protein
LEKTLHWKYAKLCKVTIQTEKINITGKNKALIHVYGWFSAGILWRKS